MCFSVCYLNGTDFQCRCEDQFVWSYGNCITYGACDEIIDEVCGCINSIPSDRQYCKPKKGDRDLLKDYHNNIITFFQLYHLNECNVNVSAKVSTRTCLITLFINSSWSYLWIPDFHWGEHNRHRSAGKHAEKHNFPCPNQPSSKHLRHWYNYR